MLTCFSKTGLLSVVQVSAEMLEQEVFYTIGRLLCGYCSVWLFKTRSCIAFVQDLKSHKVGLSRKVFWLS